MNPDLMITMHRQGGVFTTGQALDAGMNRDELRFLLRRGDLTRVRRDVYTRSELLRDADDRERHGIAVAAALVTRGWRAGGAGADLPLVAGHRSAAMLWKLPVVRPRSEATAPATTSSLFLPPDHVELVSRDRCRRTYRAGVSVRPASLPSDHNAELEGIPLTSLARTAVDLMRECSRLDAVIVADVALRLGCTRADLEAAARHCALWRGGRQAMELASFADGRAESAAESIARLVVHDNGLPTPEPQWEIRDRAGRLRRLDLGFVRQRTSLEVDGKVKYDEPFGDPAQVLWAEKLREDDIRDVEWEVVRATWHQLVFEPQVVIGRLRRAFARSEMRRAS